MGKLFDLDIGPSVRKFWVETTIQIFIAGCISSLHRIGDYNDGLDG